MDRDEKLTVLLPLKISARMNAALVRESGGARRRADWIRTRISEGLTRAREERRRTVKVSREEAETLQEVRQLGGNPVAILRTAIPALTGGPAPEASR